VCIGVDNLLQTSTSSLITENWEIHITFQKKIEKTNKKQQENVTIYADTQHQFSIKWTLILSLTSTTRRKN